jgi:4a-hydroxytetrahydrobiopterin dehydratase
MNLAAKHCVPCEGTEDPFGDVEIARYMPGLSRTWDVADGKKIRHQFTFKTFPESVAFVNKILPIAESEGHHPDIHIYYNKVTIELWTHAIGGLSENDFVMAAKIENLV